jgi:hypothetical protein
MYESTHIWSRACLGTAELSITKHRAGASVCQASASVCHKEGAGPHLGVETAQFLAQDVREHRYALLHQVRRCRTIPARSRQTTSHASQSCPRLCPADSQGTRWMHQSDACAMHHAHCCGLNRAAEALDRTSIHVRLGDDCVGVRGLHGHLVEFAANLHEVAYVGDVDANLRTQPSLTALSEILAAGSNCSPRVGCWFGWRKR